MSERIDHDNYEAWLLDRLEGNLTPEQERELDAFLLLNPHLAPDDDALPTIGGPALGLDASDKEALKRTLPPTGLPKEPIDDFLIARLEGDLTPEQTEALRLYLIDHPEHQRAERLYALTKLVPEAMAYAAKRDLRRSLPPVGLPDQRTVGDFLIARLEGDLTAEQEAALSAWMATDPAAQRDWAILQRTRVTADQVTFPNKDALKRRGKVIALGTWPQRLAMAASVALLLGVGWWWTQGNSVDPSDLAATRPAANGSVRTDLPSGPDMGPTKEQHTVLPEEGTRNNNVSADQVVAPTPVRTQEQRQDDTPVRVPAPVVAPEPLLAQDATPVAAPEDQGTHQVFPDPVVDDAAMAQTSAQPAQVEKSPATEEEMTVGGLLASTFREKVLEEARPNTAPLGADDAIAAVDKGLKAVVGDKAGLSVERRGGRVSSFDLRLGRNLAIAANR